MGAAGLFEPDEGRNADKAREILVLNDWVTPHENFHPVLDKPIFFYWIDCDCLSILRRIRVGGALAVGNGRARMHGAHLSLCSMRAGDVGPRYGAFSILLTSFEFFVLSRVVIFDMLLDLFPNLGSLCAFYEARFMPRTPNGVGSGP